MHSILVSDILHQLLKGIFLHHIVQWILALIEIERQEHGGPGISELERRLKFMPAFPGIRAFYMGLNFSRWSAGDAQQLAAIFAPAIYGLVPTPALRCTVALLEFVYFANLPVFGNEERDSLQQAKTRFFADLAAFACVRVGKDGKEKGFDNIPKIHALHHYDDDIVNVGPVTFLSTEYSEALHSVDLKDPFRGTNKNNADSQILNRNFLQDAFQLKTAYLEDVGLLPNEAARPRGARHVDHGGNIGVFMAKTPGKITL
ncbi:hypothetical protein BT69DRAFT_1274972 [Atractiella rhizophila]|nr:hypothetical protein BT69DRAFT_1274972 [Atractiella rhizophila]